MDRDGKLPDVQLDEVVGGGGNGNRGGVNGLVGGIDGGLFRNHLIALGVEDKREKPEKGDGNFVAHCKKNGAEV